MSGLFGSVTIKGNRLTDFTDQTSAVGLPIPFGFGTFAVDGNIIWADKVKEHVTKKKQGKGGVKTETYTYTRSYAIAFCEGPIFGYLTIRRNGKVVYTTDPNAAVEDRDYAAKWAQKAAFYFGTRTQNPDSTIEAVVGAGNVSAFRDLAYIVIENDDVTDMSGAVPNYQAVVVATPPEVYMTSRVYPIYDVQAVQASSSLPFGHLLGALNPVEGVTATTSLIYGDLEVVVTYGTITAPTEALDASSSLVSGELTVTTSYGSFTAPTEALDASSSIVSATLTDAAGYVSYQIPTEGCSAQSFLVSGVLANG